MNKIVFVTPSVKTGGGNRVFIELANLLSERYDTSVLYPNNSMEQNTFSKNEKLKYIPIGKNATTKIGKLLNMLRCADYINRFLRDANLIVTDPIFCLFIPFIRNKQRIFRFIQADDYRIFDDGAILGKGVLLKLYKMLCLRVYKENVNYIFNSRFVYNQLCRDSMRENIPYEKVYPAVNHRIFNSVDRKRSSSGISICLVARKHPMKGLQTFINMYHGLSPEIRGNIDSVTLISHDDLSGYDITGMTIVKPASDYDIVSVYKSSDIFISTSWWEGFGLPPLEAMACGCAVICSASGGVDEFAKPNLNCLMFKPKDETGLANALAELVGNESLRNDLSSQGVKTAAEFRWEDSAEHLLNIVNK